eukprot:979561-Rhodomonas_salina.1
MGTASDGAICLIQESANPLVYISGRPIEEPDLAWISASTAMRCINSGLSECRGDFSPSRLGGAQLTLPSSIKTSILCNQSSQVRVE